MTKPRVQCANEKTCTRAHKGALARHRFSTRRYSASQNPPRSYANTRPASFHTGPLPPLPVLERPWSRGAAVDTVAAGASFLLGLPAASPLFCAGRVKQVLPAAPTTDSSFLPLAATVSPPRPRHKGGVGVRGGLGGGHNGLTTHLAEPLLLLARGLYEGKKTIHNGGDGGGT